MLRPGGKGSSSSIQLNYYSITFLHLHWNLYKLARTLITQRLQGKKLFQDFSRSVDLCSIKKKKSQKKGKIFLKMKNLFFSRIQCCSGRIFFFFPKKESIAGHYYSGFLYVCVCFFVCFTEAPGLGNSWE